MKSGESSVYRAAALLLGQGARNEIVPVGLKMNEDGLLIYLQLGD